VVSSAAAHRPCKPPSKMRSLKFTVGQSIVHQGPPFELVPPHGPPSLRNQEKGPADNPVRGLSRAPEEQEAARQVLLRWAQDSRGGERHGTEFSTRKWLGQEENWYAAILVCVI